MLYKPRGVSFSYSFETPDLRHGTVLARNSIGMDDFLSKIGTDLWARYVQ